MGGESMASSPEQAARQRQVRSEVAPVVRRLVEGALIGPSHQLLCYGCGRGADVAWLKVRGFDVTGFDPYPPFGYSEAPREKYDRVLMIYLMSRLKTDANRRSAVMKAFRHVRPGGYLIIASRNGARLARARGGTREEGAAYLEGLLDECETESISTPVLRDEGSGLCLMARRAGLHQPSTPWEWVDDPVRFAAVCEQLNRAPVVALDVETTLEEPRKLCTIQLGVPGQTWIVDALALDDLDPLKRVMENDAVEVVIHNALFEEQMLGKHGIRITRIFDTLPASRKKHGRNKVRGSHKLGDVCERELGIYLDKSKQTSDWTRRPLDPTQLAYAAIDAEVLLDLYHVFKPPREPEPLDLFPM